MSSGYPKVHFIHPSLQALLPMYRLVRDALSGENAIKAQKELYLPHPAKKKEIKNGVDKRYDNYQKRANYYNITKRTLNGLVGQVFMKDPVVKVPPELTLVEEDSTGTGVPLVQQSKKVLSLVLSFSRCGLFTDYPSVEGPITQAEIETNHIRPTIKTYHAEEIVNWRVTEKGGKSVLSMVALYETYPFSDDGFERKTAEQYRVLRLDEDGHYYQQIWRENDASEKKATDPFALRAENGHSSTLNPSWRPYKKVYPTNHKGEFFTEIPFAFVGSENNDHNPDNPNLFDLASMNIAHFRNSADYEEGVFVSGQPTLFVSGLTEKWLKEVMGGKVEFGSLGGIGGPENSTAKLLQAAPEMAALSAMEHKEKQMVALGAKLVEQKKVERTAFEVRLEATADGSVLSNTTKNVSAAIEKSLGWCAQFVGTDGEIEFKLNTQYDLVKMGSDEINQLILTWQEGLLSFKEARDKLRQDNLATEPDEKVKAEYDARKKEEIEMQRAQFAAEQSTNPNKDSGDDERGNNE